MEYEEDIDIDRLDSLATYLLRDRGVEVIDSAIFYNPIYYSIDEIAKEFRVVSLLWGDVFKEEMLFLINKSASIPK